MNLEPLVAKIQPKLNNDIFILHQGDKHYLYSPINRVYSALNMDMLTFLKACDGTKTLKQIFHDIDLPEDILPVISTLLKHHILLDFTNGCKGYEINDIDSGEKLGMKLTLFPSTACNLKCKYCYANGGDNPQYMSKDIYQISIDHFFKNIPEGLDQAVLSIHGGGEPTLNFSLLKDICDYFFQKSSDFNRSPKISITSNGTYEENVCQWIIDNNIGISFSLDGPAHIQNFQRPFRSGAPSFETVINNIKALIETGRQVGIRSTVTSTSVSAMKDTIEMAKETGIATVHFEPVFKTARSIANNVEPPKIEHFVKEFLDCFLMGLNYDIDVSYSGLRCYDEPTLRFCSACGFNFCVTVDGYITSCYEVLEKNDPASDCFFIGKINLAERKIVLNHEKIKYLRTRTALNLNLCEDCFLRFNCAGDCPIKVFRKNGGDLFARNEERCSLAQAINKQVIAWIADGVIEPRDSRKQNVYSYNCGALS